MTEIVINNTSLDIYKDIPISLNYSIADIRNPDKRNTSFSKTITLPGSKKNNLLFNHIFEISKESNSEDIVNFSPDFNPSIKAACRVYSDTMLQMDGYCQLLKVIKTKNTFEYEICIFGVLGDFFTNIDGKFLTDLDFSEYSHELIQSNIEKSWDIGIQKDGSNYDNFDTTYSLTKSGEVLDSNTILSYLTLTSEILNGDIIYINGLLNIAVARAGVGPDLAISLAVPTLLVAGAAITITKGAIKTPIGEGYVYPCINYGYGTSMYQYDALTMYPSLYLKSYIDKIFKLAGFTYSGSFKDLELLKRLVIPASSNADRVSAGVTNTNTVIQSYTADTLIVDIYKPNTVAENYMLFPDTVQDIADIFNTTNGITTIKKAGSYEIIIDYIIEATGEVLDYPPYAYDVQLPAYANLKIKCYGANGSNVFNTVVIASNDGTYTGQVKIPNINFIQGGTIRISIEGSAHIKAKIGTQLTIKPIGIPIGIGDTMNPNATIPKDIALKDLFLSIIKMFNLYIRPDETNQNNLIIETANDFYNGNQVLEWSGKVDRLSPIEIFPVSEIEGKDYLFTYKEDGDYYNQLYTDTYKEVYGNRDVSVLNDFAKGSKEIGVVFSPTISVDSPLNKMVVPHIVTRNDDGTFSPFDSNIRILYYGGLKTCSGSFKIKYGASNISYTTYPYVGHVDDPYSPNLDLCFEIPKILYWRTLIYTTANLYNVYYRKFIDEITDKNSKLLRVYLRLKNSDISSLNFKNFIQVDNINYRLNKILDYSPIEPSLCIAELSKIKNGVDYSAYQIDLNPTIAQNLIQGGLDEVRSPFATSYIQLIQGGLDEVQAMFSDSPIKIINGGTD